MLITEAEATPTTTVSFLAAGPRFVVPIPDGFDPVPNVYTVLDWGNGARIVWSGPSNRLPPIDLDSYRERKEIAESFNGRVQCFERFTANPLTWVVRFLHDAGFVETHVRGDEGFDTVRLVAKTVTVVVDKVASTPFLLLEAPTKLVSRLGGEYQDRIEFVRDADPSKSVGSVVLTRPIDPRRDRAKVNVLYRDDAGWAECSSVSDVGCEVLAAGPIDDATRVASDLAATITIA